MKVVLFKIRTRKDIDVEAYTREFEKMLQQVSKHAGFISIEGYQGEDGSELALATFESEQAILAWRDDPEHVKTRQRGRDEFFEAYDLTIATVERHYDWARQDVRGPSFEDGI